MTAGAPGLQADLVREGGGVKGVGLLRAVLRLGEAGYGPVAAEQSFVGAVEESMSIPLYFRPVQVATATGHATWVHGGLLSNFPITAFDRTGGRPARWPTWGVKLSGAPAEEKDNPVTSAPGWS